MLSKSYLSLAVILCASVALGSPAHDRIATGDGIIPEKGDLAYQALVHRLIEGRPLYLCGGAIVSDKHILTSAECVESYDQSRLSVVVGLDERKQVKRIYSHPWYSDKKNNIALLELTEPLNFTELIQPISFNSTEEIDNEEVTALGVQKLVNGVGVLKSIKNRNS